MGVYLFASIRRMLLLPACLALSFLIGGCDFAPKTFATASGGMIDLDAHAEKWVFINYWAPWCAPCREEIPELNAFAEEYPERVLVLGVHLDGTSGEKLLEDIRELDIQFPVLSVDPGPALGLRLAPVVPITWVLAPGNKPQEMLLGPQTEDELAEAMSAL
jgi:thiol-disulfide isomerase/thioredoxin